ncbi:flagellin [Planctomycetales bacterium]|nr:flagellin [Planctomycetales bacterium]
MAITFINDATLLRSILAFNNLSQQIYEIGFRLETGQRINSAKDDPAGLQLQSTLRRDLRGLESAKKNVSADQQMLKIADGALQDVSFALIGDIFDDTQNGLLGLLYDDTIPAAFIQGQVHDILNIIDASIGSAKYGDKRLLDGSMDYKIRNQDTAKVSNLNVRSAEIPGQNGLQVNIKVLTAAEKATLQFDTTQSLFDQDADPAASMLNQNVKFVVKGTDGAETLLQFNNGQTVQNIVDGITAATGANISARLDGNNIVFESLDKGAAQSVSVRTFAETSPNVWVPSLWQSVDRYGHASETANGVNLVADVNGQRATTNGQNVTFYSDRLQMSATLADTLRTGETTSFTIASGGVVFQLGRDVTTENQYRTTLRNMTTGHLGGADGVLAQLRTLDWTSEADKELARKIVVEANQMVVAERTKIGAVQQAVLEPAALHLDKAITDTAEADAMISNADTAYESSRLNRANLLAQTAMDAILFYRNFQQLTLASLLQ